MDTHEDLKSMYTKLVDNLNCAICQDTLNDARDLTCGHTFCLACLQELVAIKGWTSVIKSCPVCKKQTTIPLAGLSGLKQNYKLNCIIDEQKALMTKMKIPAPHQQGKPGARKTFQIQVKNLEGKTLSFYVQLSDTVYIFKLQVEKKTGIPPNVQRLTYQNKQLENAREDVELTLEDYGVDAHCIIQICGRGQGGEMTQ